MIFFHNMKFKKYGSLNHTVIPYACQSKELSIIDSFNLRTVIHYIVHLIFQDIMEIDISILNSLL